MSENAPEESDSVAKNVLSLKQGDVYFMWHDGLKDKYRPHFHIILNKAPLKDNLICTAVITSHPDKVRELAKQRNYRPGTLVELDDKGYFELNKPSVIDCNSLPEMEKEKFENYITQEKFLAEPRKDFPKGLLSEVLEGVKNSNLVSPEQRKLIFGESEQLP